MFFIPSLSPQSPAASTAGVLASRCIAAYTAAVDRRSILVMLDGPKGQVASDRYRLLVESIGGEFGNVYGWRSRAARMLDVRPSYIAKVLNREISQVGPPAILKAIEAGFPADYFLGEDDPPPGLPERSKENLATEKQTHALEEEQLYLTFESLTASAELWMASPDAKHTELALAVLRSPLCRDALELVTAGVPDNQTAATALRLADSVQLIGKWAAMYAAIQAHRSADTKK